MSVWLTYSVSIRVSSLNNLLSYSKPGVNDQDIPILPTDPTIAASLIRNGCLPCAPFKPTVVITIRAVEFFRLSHLRCPHFSVQSYAKTLCDMHGVSTSFSTITHIGFTFTLQVPFGRWLSRQFSIAYDLYLDIRRRVDSLIQVALKRDAPNWRLQNACPACTFKLKDEPKLKFDMLFTMDGNDSLKRVLRRGDKGLDVERPDDRFLDTDYYVTRKDVDRWAECTTKKDSASPKVLIFLLNHLQYMLIVFFLGSG